MKITFDTDKNILKVGKTLFDDLKSDKKEEMLEHLRNFLKKQPMSDYEDDCMWMSYRYCIGGHTIATHMHSYEIYKNCYGRMSDDRSNFIAFDMNREIEDLLRFGIGGPDFHFPSTGLNRIYTSALDVYFEFLNEYQIRSKEELLKYKSVEIILTDNERGYKFEPKTYEEYGEKPKKSSESFFMSGVQDLMVWNDLVHIFDKEHHHKSVLKDGSEVEWFWTYIKSPHLKMYHDTKSDLEDFEYERIRVRVDKWSCHYVSYIPESAIKETLW